MTLNEIKSDIVKSNTEILRQRYNLYRNLKSMGVKDVVVRDLLESELQRRRVSGIKDTR